MKNLNQKLHDIADEILEQEQAQEYSDFVQSKLAEFYMQEMAAQSYDSDSIFYGEVV